MKTIRCLLRLAVLPASNPFAGGLAGALLVLGLMVVSTLAGLIVGTPPTITTQPVNLTVSVGQNAFFTVAASGTVPLNYQWRTNGVNITGATSDTLSLGIARADQAGSYTVVVSNAGGSVTSAPPAVLTVNAVSSGTVVVWGRNTDASGTVVGQTNVPFAAQSGVTAIAAGEFHTVALKNDGTVLAWGNNTQGECNVPASLSGVTAIAAGHYHTVALKSDGAVVAWGYNNEAQIDVPTGLSGVMAIAAGRFHTVALKNDGSVVAWGNNTYVQTTVPLAAQSGVVAIAAGAYHTVALKNDGTVVAWGGNIYGQTTVPTGMTGVTEIAAGGTHTVALKNDGMVVAWGDNTYGQTNALVATQSGVTEIAAGGTHTVALKNDGMVVAWGDNTYGQTNVPVATQGGVTMIAAGGYHTVTLVRTGFIGPSITTTSTGTNLTLLWPATGTGFRVESTASLLLPISWTNLVGSFQTNGGTISFVLPITGAQKFYRLANP